MKKKLVLYLILMPLLPDAFAQGCAVCSRTTASLGEEGARGLNAGIVYLALLPLTIMITIGLMWWRSNKTTETTSVAINDDFTVFTNKS